MPLTIGNFVTTIEIGQIREHLMENAADNSEGQVAKESLVKAYGTLRPDRQLLI